MGVDIWLLSETKLTKAAYFEGYYIQQTTSSSKGGCVTLVDRSKIPRMKLMKIIWAKKRKRRMTIRQDLVKLRRKKTDIFMRNLGKYLFRIQNKRIE